MRPCMFARSVLNALAKASTSIAALNSGETNTTKSSRSANVGICAALYRVEINFSLSAMARIFRSALLASDSDDSRSEEHTSELQSRFDLVCRLLLEKKN